MRTMSQRLLVFGFVCLVGVLVCLPMAARGGTDVPVNSDPPNTVQNEVSLTLNPGLASNVVTAYNDSLYTASPVTLGVSYSMDGGGSWNDVQLSTPIAPDGVTPMSFVFDPITGAGTASAGLLGQGRVYGGYIATGPNNTSGLYVEYSDDGGASWNLPMVPGPPPSSLSVAYNPGPVGPFPDLNYRFNDKPHLSVDRGGSSHSDNVYVAWIQDVGWDPALNPMPWGDIMFSTSTNQALAWSTPQKISDAASGTGRGNGPNTAVAPDGTVYVGWLDVDVTDLNNHKFGTLMFDKSTNGGASFGTDVAIRTVKTTPNWLSTETGSQDDARARGYPAIATSPTNSQEVYMVYTADPDGSIGPDEADIYFIKSTDGGANWSSTPLRVNDDSTATDQFEPWIAVKPDGTIDVVWYDKRNSPDIGGSGAPDDDHWDVYIANSTDFGASFSTNLRVTDTSYATPNTPGGPWIGEYLGLAVDASNAYIGFTSAVNDPGYGDVFFDVIPNSQIPEPSTLVLLGMGSLLMVPVLVRKAAGRKR